MSALLAAYILAAWLGVAFTLGPIVGRILAAQSFAPEKSNEAGASSSPEAAPTSSTAKG
jgi:hypothetical protein